MENTYPERMRETMKDTVKVKTNFTEIKRRGKEKGLKSENQICKYAGIDNDYYRHGKLKGKLSIEGLWLIAEALDCKIDDLIEIVWN